MVLFDWSEHQDDCKVDVRNKQTVHVINKPVMHIFIMVEGSLHKPIGIYMGI